jgi:phosphosulfolactate synthase (CoM biosynthesis protein A)
MQLVIVMEEGQTNANNEWSFLKTNYRGVKPRTVGITEIRGPYYSIMGKRYLSDLLETAGYWVDSLKFAGGSFTLLPPQALLEIIETAHEHNVLVSTGGFMEYVLTQGKHAVQQYIQTCKRFGFDIIEISSGFITLSSNDWLRLIEMVKQEGLKAKPEVGVQFGAGGGSGASVLRQAGSRDTGFAIKQARRFIESGAYMVMIESEGITENTDPWRTDIVAQFIDELGTEKLMFEAADPGVFEWYIKNYGHEVNLFVDHSQILQLESLRRGIWGTATTWGRIQGL